MMKTLKSLFWCMLLVSCGSPQPDNTGLLTADIRDQISKPTLLNLNDEIESVTYIPLELTADDASLVGGILGYAVTDKYIYVHSAEDTRVVLFDRQGRFIKTLIPFGQGPGEFNGVFMGMRANQEDDRLYVYSTERVFEYNLEGEFIKQTTPNLQYISINPLGKDRLAAVGFPYMTFQSGNFGIGVFSENGDPIATKNDFHSPLVEPEKQGFTIGLTMPAYSQQLNSVLFKTGSNDTVFRISYDKIEPTCILNLRNSNDEIIRSLDATDFNSMAGGPFGKDGDIFIADMFETMNQYYFRLVYNREYYVASLNKETGKALVEKCKQPGSIERLASANIQLGMMGTMSYNNFPVWGVMDGSNLVQIITPYELGLFEDVDSIVVPEELNLDEESNPVIVLYKIKD